MENTTLIIWVTRLRCQEERRGRRTRTEAANRLDRIRVIRTTGRADVLLNNDQRVGIKVRVSVSDWHKSLGLLSSSDHRSWVSNLVNLKSPKPMVLYQYQLHSHLLQSLSLYKSWSQETCLKTRKCDNHTSTIFCRDFWDIQKRYQKYFFILHLTFLGPKRILNCISLSWKDFRYFCMLL